MQQSDEGKAPGVVGDTASSVVSVTGVCTLLHRLFWEMSFGSSCTHTSEGICRRKKNFFYISNNNGRKTEGHSAYWCFDRVLMVEMEYL